MSASGPSTPSPTSPPSPRRISLRIRAAFIFVGLLAEVFVGNELALAGSPYPIGWLAAHILISLGLVVGTGFAVMVAFWVSGWGARAVALITFLATLGATIEGTLFLYAGEHQTSLNGMEGLAVVALLGALILMIVGGARATPPSPTTPSSS